MNYRKTSFLALWKRKLAGALTIFVAGLVLAPVARAGNGATNYIDFNGSTAGFGSSVGVSLIAESTAIWTTNTAGGQTNGLRTSGTQLTIGLSGSDFDGESFSINLDGGGNLQGILINSTNVNVTLTGTANTHNNSTPNTWTVNGASILNVNDTRQTSGSLKGLNWNNIAVTLAGSGTYNFQTPIGANSTGLNTQNTVGGTVNLQQLSTGVNSYTGGYTLTNGTLNFATAQAANTFNGFTSGKLFGIGGGTIDNTSGAPVMLTVGTSGYNIGGDFTFTGGSSLSFDSGPVALTGNRKITVTANTLAIPGVISGAGFGLTKAGNGTLTLGGINTYTGNTTVNAGTLALTNTASLSASPLVSLPDGTTFDTSAMTVRLNLGTLAFTNSTLAIDPLTGVTNIVAGNLNLGGTTNTINLIAIPVVISYPTIFHLIGYSNLVGSYNFVLGSVPQSSFPFLGFLTNNAGSKTIDYVLTSGPTPVRQLTWNGNDPSGGNWDIGNTPNWTDTNGTSVPYQEAPNGDLVRFDETATGVTTVNLTTTLTPSAVTVSNSLKTYTFMGNGSLNGPWSLQKLGTGTLILDNISPNGYSGGTLINGGAVQLGNNNGGGDLGTGNVVNNGTLIWNRSDVTSLTNNISGSGSIVQNGIGIFSLGGNSSFSGAVTVNQGILQAGNATALGTNTITIANGASLDLGGNALTNRQIIVSGPGTNGYAAIDNTGLNIFPALTFVTLAGDTTFGTDAGNTSTTRGRWDLRSPGGTTGSATTASLSTGGHPYALTKVGPQLVGIVSVTVDPKLGPIDIQGGTLDYEGNTTGLGDPAYDLTIESGATLQLFATTVPLAKPIVLHGGAILDNNSGVNTVLSPILLPDTSGNGTLKVDGTTTLNVNGVVSGAGNLAQQGATGTMNLNGTNTFTGTLTLSSGNMNINGDESGITNSIFVSSGTLTLNTVLGGPLLTGFGTFFVANGTNQGPVDISGTIYPGGSNAPGTFTANNGFTLESGATIGFDLVYSNTPGGGINDLIVVSNGLTFNGGAIAINPVGILAAGAKYRLFNYTGQLNGTPPTPNSVAGYNFTIDTSTPGEVDLIASGGPPLWNGGSTVNNNWSDPNNWSGSGIFGGSILYFLGPNRTNTVNDTTADTPYGDINFVTGAASFSLSGNPIVPTGNILNNSTNVETIALGLDFNQNFTMSGTAGPLIIGGGLTNTASSVKLITLAGTGVLTNLLASSDPGGTNTLVMATSNANWTLVDNASSTLITVPWLLNLTNGTFNFGTANSAPKLSSTTVNGQPQDWIVGAAANSTATLNINNGVLTTLARLNTGTAANATGIINQTGGIYNMGSQFQGANGAPTAVSIVNLSGGTMNIGSATNPASPFYVASRGPGTLSVSGTAALNCGVLDVSRAINGGIPGIVNLNGGTITVQRVGTATANSVATNTGDTATFNFNGGTLKAATNSATWYQGNTGTPTVPIATFVKSGGAIIDDGGFAISVLEPLQHDASGPLTDGGLTKKGAGTMTLTAASTYTGATLVSAGTLTVNGSLGTNSTTVAANAKLSGTGTLNGSLLVSAGGTVSPGGTNAIGKLTVAGTVSLPGTAFMKLSKAGAPTNDSISGATLIDYAGGTLQLTNISANALAVGDTFKLFAAATYLNSFAVIVPATPGPGLVWNTNNLPVNGILSVTNIPALPATIGMVSINGSTFVIHASGGVPNGTFRVLSSTNVTAPVASWTLAGSGSYDNNGNLVFNGTFNPADASRYFVIVSP